MFLVSPLIMRMGSKLMMTENIMFGHSWPIGFVDGFGDSGYVCTAYRVSAASKACSCKEDGSSFRRRRRTCREKESSWAPAALACIYHTLVFKFSREVCDTYLDWSSSSLSFDLLRHRQRRLTMQSENTLKALTESLSSTVDSALPKNLQDLRDTIQNIQKSLRKKRLRFPSQSLLKWWVFLLHKAVVFPCLS